MISTCTVCRATVVITGPEYPTFMCEDCNFDLVRSQMEHDAFLRVELPKFKAIIGQLEDGIITVEDFYSRMAEMVEPF